MADENTPSDDASNKSPSDNNGSGPPDDAQANEIGSNQPEDGGRLIDLPIEQELKESYLTYAMSVIVSRAFLMFVMVSSRRSGGSWLL